MRIDPVVSRRAVVAAGVATVGALALGASDSGTSATAMGLASNVFDVRRAAQSAGGKPPSISDPMEFLQECQRLGAGGIQGPLGIRDDRYAAHLRQFAEDHGLYVESSIMPPRDSSAIERFEKEILTAKACGAGIARTVVFPGRRYETFDSLQQFAQASERARKSLELAEPIVRRHGIRLAVENHKDQRVAERLDMLRRLGSEYIGTCMDVGNSFALCEDPMEVVRAYAPTAWSVHLKDQAVQAYKDGFLFGDAPLGKGFLDLPAIVALLRQANPKIHFNLEVITRDPLRVPVFTPKYWSTMPGVPATELARTMHTVQTKGSAGPLARLTELPPERRVATETANITSSIAFAKEVLRL